MSPLTYAKYVWSFDAQIVIYLFTIVYLCVNKLFVKL